MKYRKLLITTSSAGLFVYFSSKAYRDGVQIGQVFPTVRAESFEQSPGSSSGLKLKQAQIFFRHGARTPLHLIPKIEEVSYPADLLMTDVPHTSFRYQEKNLEGGEREPSPYEKYYSTKILKGGSCVGSLTRLGQDQMYIIGRKLADEYIRKHKLISATYDPNDVYARSTNIDRTVKSARCVLAGMFGSDNLNSLPEQPIIHIDHADEDALLPRPGKCPVLRQVNHAALTHGGDFPGIKEDRLFLEEILGIDSSGGGKQLKFIDACDDLVARQTYGHPIPSELVPHLATIKKNGALLMYFAFCGQHEAERPVITRLASGPAITMVQDVMDRKSYKLILYSCHDSTLVGMMGLLDIFEGKWPPFGSQLTFELYEDEKGKEFVKVLFNDKAQIIRGCDSELTSLEEFKRSVKPYTVTEKEHFTICHSNILEIIAKEILEAEKGEIEDEESKERSDIAAGL